MTLYAEGVFFIALLPVLLGVLVGWGGYLGWREKLPRDRGAGVRTAATLRSDEAFRVANKVAGMPTMVAGAVGVIGGGAGLLMPTTGGLIAASVIGLLGMFALLAGGGVLGHRAATAVPAPPAPTGCGGCACGGGGCGSALAADAAQ
ncbi:SdpI/YhfL protein family protein [Amycolatopsis marina]|uniref:SdpI/YhfL protein family protein n=1 Tax=Amycolatopsis marina TaxID=490629 RepID=A0A1I0VWH8_9PSEU|nr:SdpI family protein [Amycolatopsis marina]SFA80789.1 SdpI/YhfL protein family protein [Amycolatopsis marina]